MQRLESATVATIIALRIMTSASNRSTPSSESLLRANRPAIRTASVQTAFGD